MDNTNAKKPAPSLTGIELGGMAGKPYASAEGVQNGKTKMPSHLVGSASKGDQPTGHGGRRENRGYGE